MIAGGIHEQVPDPLAAHLAAQVPGGGLGGPVEAHDAAEAVDHEDERGGRVHHGRAEVPLLLEGDLLAGGDVLEVADEVERLVVGPRTSETDSSTHIWCPEAWK